MCGPMRGQRCVSLVIYTGWPRGEDVRESVTAPVSNINNGHVHKNVKMTLSKRWFSSPMFNAKTIDRICSSVFIWRHRGHWAYHQLTTLMWPKHSHSSHTLPSWPGASQSHFYTILINNSQNKLSGQQLSCYQSTPEFSRWPRACESQSGPCLVSSDLGPQANLLDSISIILGTPPFICGPPQGQWWVPWLSSYWSKWLTLASDWLSALL